MDESWKRRIGWTMSGLLAAFLIFASALPKFLGIEAATAIMQTLGWPPGYLVMIGCIEVACALLVLYPPTALLGGILTMSLLGGAIAANLRVGQPLFSRTLFSVYLGIWMWAALWLRIPALRRLFPSAA